jgi:hypothetical protein
VRDHGDDLAAKDPVVGLEGFLAIAVEGEVGIDLHAALSLGFSEWS